MKIFNKKLMKYDKILIWDVILLTKKKNYIKNYIILVVLFIVCFGFTLYLCRWYNVYNEYKKETPEIRGTLSEITYGELDHYVVDNSSMLMYLCTSNSNECRNFEKKLKKYVNREELNEEIVYLNLTGVDQDEFVNEFNLTYNLKNKLTTNYPAFILFRDGRVESILQGTNKNVLTISKLDNFIELNNYDIEGE